MCVCGAEYGTTLAKQDILVCVQSETMMMGEQNNPVCTIPVFLFLFYWTRLIMHCLMGTRYQGSLMVLAVPVILDDSGTLHVPVHSQIRILTCTYAVLLHR